MLKPEEKPTKEEFVSSIGPELIILLGLHDV
jgi:hypothetical protein